MRRVFTAATWLPLVVLAAGARADWPADGKFVMKVHDSFNGVRMARVFELPSGDLVVLGVGSEDLRLVLLEFDRKGVLRLVETGEFSSSQDGEYFAIDDRIIVNFLEDRSRVLAMVDEDEDDEDEDLKRKK